MLAATAAGVDAVLNGRPRPLYGASSVLATDEWQTRFARSPAYRAEYEWAAASIRTSGARRVGMVANGSQVEYPWWLLLRDLELVNLDSSVPGHPAPESTTVDAIVCFDPPPPNCAAEVPPGWTLQTRTSVAVALPVRG